jgi:biopolymer transport protein ExbB
LIAAIPLLAFHSVLQTKTTEIIDSMEMAGVKCLNALIASKDLSTQSRSSDDNR